MLLMVVGLSGAIVALASGLWPSLIGAICLLSWSAGEVCKVLWQQFKANPEAFPPQIGAPHTLTPPFSSCFDITLVCLCDSCCRW